MDTKKSEKVQKKTVSTYLKQGFSYIMKHKKVILGGVSLGVFLYFQNKITNQIEKNTANIASLNDKLNKNTISLRKQIVDNEQNISSLWYNVDMLINRW